MTSTMLHKILRNPVYQGRVVVKAWGVDVAADFEALVDEQTFAERAGVTASSRPSPPTSATTRTSRCAASSAAGTATGR